MTNQAQTTGTITYTARAAVYDAAAAMRGDVVRGMVEMITNANDSYRRLKTGGTIRIRVWRTRQAEFNRIAVGDRAEGMTLEDLNSKVLTAGGRTSGEGARGILGRGGKDIAHFGKATYESIHDGRYAQVTILPTFEFVDRVERAVTDADRTRLEIPSGNGTVTTMYVRREQYSVPRHETLIRRLQNHVQLRDIMSAEGCAVELVDASRAGSPTTTLHYRPPVARELVLNRHRLNLKRYPDAEATLTLWRCAELLEDDRSSERHSGILICSPTTVFQSTYYSFEGRSGALRFGGRVDSASIKAIQDEYDDALEATGRGTERAPLPLTTRTRDGLEPDHPFAQDLRVAVEEVFAPYVEREEAQQDEQAGQASEETRRRMRRAERELSEKYSEIARRFEVDVKREGPEGPAAPDSALLVVPPSVRLAPGEAKIFSVYVYPGMLDEDEEGPEVVRAHISSADEAVAAVEPAEVILAEDLGHLTRWRGTFTVTAGSDEDATLVEVRFERRSEVVLVDVVVPELPPIVAPERLVFEQSSYRVQINRPKRIVLLAPNSLVNAEGTTIAIRATDAAVQCPEEALLAQVAADDGVTTWWEAAIEVRLTTPLRGRLRASLGGQAAVCSVSSTDDRGKNLFSFDVIDKPPHYPSEGRARWAYPKGVKTLHILGRHTLLQRYFGEKLRNQDSLECRLLIAEILADELAAEMLIEQERRAGGQGPQTDAAAYRSRRKTIADELLIIAHRVVVGEHSPETRR